MTAASTQPREMNRGCSSDDAGGKASGTADCRELRPAPDSGQEPERIKDSLWRRLIRLLYGSFIEPLVVSRNTPHHDARGVALGLVIGFAVPVGGQLLVLTLLRFLVRFNYLAAVGFSFVSNPFNMVPLYYGYYYLGSYILGKSATLDFSVFQNLMNGVMDKAYFWEAFGAFTELGKGILERWVASAVVLSVVFGTLGYAVTLRIQNCRCHKAAERLGMEYEAFLEHLRLESCREKRGGSPEDAAKPFSGNERPAEPK